MQQVEEGLEQLYSGWDACCMQQPGFSPWDLMVPQAPQQWALSTEPGGGPENLWAWPPTQNPEKKKELNNVSDMIDWLVWDCSHGGNKRRREWKHIDTIRLRLLTPLSFFFLPLYWKAGSDERSSRFIGITDNGCRHICSQGWIIMTIIEIVFSQHKHRKIL